VRKQQAKTKRCGTAKFKGGKGCTASLPKGKNMNAVMLHKVCQLNHGSVRWTCVWERSTVETSLRVGPPQVYCR
jgi:hypothetical protein